MAKSTYAMNDIFHPNGRLRLELFSTGAAQVLENSLDYARLTGWDSVRSPHLFMGLLTICDKCIHDWCNRLEANRLRLLEQFCEIFQQNNNEQDTLLHLHREFLSDNVIRMLRESALRSALHRRPHISSTDLLISLFTTPHSVVAECFERIGVTAARLTELAVIAEQQSS